jgi:phospholipid transport system substrate-binding protein
MNGARVSTWLQDAGAKTISKSDGKNCYVQSEHIQLEGFPMEPTRLPADHLGGRDTSLAAHDDHAGRTRRERLPHLVWCATAVTWIVCGVTAAADSVPRAAMAPDVLVQSLSTEVLERVRDDTDLQKGETKKLQRLVDDSLAPWFNLERMARLSVGYRWRDATQQQREALMHEFRAYVIRTYSGALSRAVGYQVKVRPLALRSVDTDAVVHTEAASSGDDAVQIDYSLERSGAGWRIYDMKILGVSMVETFRSSFAGELTRDGIDGLIKALADRNRQLQTDKS